MSVKLNLCSDLKAELTIQTSQVPKRGVHLIVAVELCKAQYRTYPYFIKFNALMCSTLIETLGIPCRHWTMALQRALWANIDVWRDRFSVK